MAQRVMVKGVGPVDFPDDMSRDDIAAAIDRNLPRVAPQVLRDPAVKAAWAERTTRREMSALDRAEVDVGDTYQGLESSARKGWAALGQAVNTVRSTQDIRPTIGQEYRAYREAQDDPRYSMGLASTDDPQRLALLEQRFGPGAKLAGRLGQRDAAVLGAREAVADEQTRQSAMPQSRAQQELAAAQGAKQQWAAWLKNPVELTAAITLESVAPSVVGAAAGTVMAGPGLGTALGAGLSSGLLTFSSELLGAAPGQGPGFVYLRDRQTGAEGAWWDCAALPRANPTRCLPGPSTLARMLADWR
jgi:hypothetical protein